MLRRNRITHKRIALLAILCLSSIIMRAQAPQDGHIYRLVSKMYPTLVCTEDISNHGLVTRDHGDKLSFEQMWLFSGNTTSGFTLTNLLTQRAIRPSESNSSQYWTDDKKTHPFQVTEQSTGWWNIRNGKNTGGLHAAWTGKVVYWYDNAADATQWKLEEITSVSDEQLSLRRLAYNDFVEMAENEATYSKAFCAFFTDPSCSELLPSYASMSDEALLKAMEGLPKSLTDVALKVKNDQWEKYERSFRIRDYQAYSDPDYWYKVLYTTRWGRINNPTGIYGEKGDMILIFVGDEIPSGTTLAVEFIRGTDIDGSSLELHQGLNVVTAADDYAMMYIQYIGTTSPDKPKLITDYPPMRIHIERGVACGFWNMDEHTDQDWATLIANTTAPVMDVKGHKAMYHMHTSVLRSLCPNGIHEAIDWWEDMMTWQYGLMGIEEYVPGKCNNMACAITLDDDHTYMSATWYRTQYHVNVAYKVLNHSTVMSDPDYCFGPAHENGHINQGAINIAGCTESSNSLFANLVVWNLGKYLTRGPANALTYNEYAQNIPWVNRTHDAALRFWWQLYLHFHVNGADPQFFPKLFKAMRETPLPVRWADKSEVNASQDILLLARQCCAVSGLDLSDFFATYGCLTVHEKMPTHESTTYLTTTQKNVDDFLAFAHQYPKAPPIEFMDDRVRPIPRIDGGAGNRQVYDYGPGQCGDVGQYTDFLLTDTPAKDYIYSRSGNTLTIKNGTGAVGFRIYDADNGELLQLSNSYRTDLLASFAARMIRVVAVQADGTEVRIPSTAEAGTEAEQLTALRSSLKTATSMLNIKDDEGLHTGWYYGYVLDDLEALVNAANAVIDSKDQSQHTYGQWSMLLDEAIRAVTADPEAIIPIFPENTYAIYEAQFKNYSLYWFSSGPKANGSDPEGNTNKHWQFIPTDVEGRYLIQNVGNGLFITECEKDKRVRMDSDKANLALAFDIQFDNSGRASIRSAADPAVYLSYNSSKDAVGATTSAPWSFVTLTDKHAEALQMRTTAYLRAALWLEKDLQESGDEIVLAARDEQFSTLRQQFKTLYATVKGIVDGTAKGNLDRRLADLWNVMEAISPTYCRTELPVTVGHTPAGEPFNPNAQTTVYYLLQNLKTGAYAYFNDAAGRYQSCLRMGVFEDPDDTRFQFSIEKDNEGNYYFRSRFSSCTTGLWSKYLVADGTRGEVGFSLAFNDEAKGFDIFNDDGSWTAQTIANAYAQFSANGTQWKFRPIDASDATGIMLPTEDAATMSLFDLQGRPVTEPMQQGIYIQNGQKILIR